MTTKKGTPDHMTANLIYDTFSECGPSLLKVINLAMKEGTFPESRKKSLIYLINKPIDAQDLRPINYFPVYEKRFKVILHEQMIDYEERMDILCTNQFVFRKIFQKFNFL